MAPRGKQIAIRLIVNVLLAIFLANAANKFFVADLDYEMDHHFYGRIFAGVGDAPDQYRILPLLPLQVLCDYLPFNTATLVYNTLFGFLVLELFWWIMGGISTNKKFVFNLLFAGAYIYTQYTGWRPDTMGLVFICALLVNPALVVPGRGIGVKMSFRGNSGKSSRSSEEPIQGLDGETKPMEGGRVSASEGTDLNLAQAFAITLLLTALSFARADIALIFALWFIVYQSRKTVATLLWVFIPPLVQFILQEVIYPDAEYYSQKVMLLDNLSGYYLLRHPATYLIIASGIAFWRPIRAFLQRTWDQKWFYLMLLGYLGLVMVIGRINEYRLYLPFVPIFLVIWRETTTAHGPTTDPL